MVLPFVLAAASHCLYPLLLLLRTIKQSENTKHSVNLLWARPSTKVDCRTRCRVSEREWMQPFFGAGCDLLYRASLLLSHRCQGPQTEQW